MNALEEVDDGSVDGHDVVVGVECLVNGLIFFAGDCNAQSLARPPDVEGTYDFAIVDFHLHSTAAVCDAIFEFAQWHEVVAELVQEGPCIDCDADVLWDVIPRARLHGIIY